MDLGIRKTIDTIKWNTHHLVNRGVIDENGLGDSEDDRHHEMEYTSPSESWSDRREWTWGFGRR
jgi:hypothetical protein